MSRKSGCFKRRSSGNLLLGMTLGMALGCLSTPAWASQTSITALVLAESSLLRVLLKQTASGGRFVRMVESEAGSVTDHGDSGVITEARAMRLVQTLGQPRFAPLARGVVFQLEGAQLALDGPELEALDPSTLAAGQKEALELIGRRLLELRSDWSRNLARKTGLEPADFFVTVAAPSRGLSEQILAAETGSVPLDPASEAGTIPMSTAEGESWVSRWERRFSEMNRCVDEMSAADRTAAAKRWALQGFIQSQLMTIGGNLLGSKTVDWKSLPTDMLVSALWSGVNAKALFSTTQVTVQWIRLELLAQTRSGMDAAIYFVNPYKETHGLSNWEATVERERFNASYNLFSPFISIGTQRLLTGLECLFPGGRTKAWTGGLRFASHAGTTLVYFRLRSEFLDGK